MLLEKFFILAIILQFIAAAPAKNEITTDVDTTTIASQEDITATPVIDTHQNEVDGKLSNDDTRTTTLSDIDEKIENIELDYVEKTTQEADALAQIKEIEPESIEEETEDVSSFMATTSATISTTTKYLEETSTFDAREVEETTATTVDERIARQSEEIELIQELKNNNELEYLTKGEDDEGEEEEEVETREDEEVSTSTTMSLPLTTTSQITTELTQRSVDLADKISTSVPELSERVKTLERIRNALRVHVLRTLLSLLSEARNRQNVQESHAMESQLIEEFVPAVGAIASSNSECDCGGENDDVSTNDDDKIITFDKNLQRYVYKDEKDLEKMNGLKHREDYVM